MSHNLTAWKPANDALIRAALAEEENSNDSLGGILFSKMEELFRLTNKPWGTRPPLATTETESKGGAEMAGNISQGS